MMVDYPCGTDKRKERREEWGEKGEMKEMMDYYSKVIAIEFHAP